MLRDGTKEEKIKYIEETGLRVASDDFYFKESDKIAKTKEYWTDKPQGKEVW